MTTAERLRMEGREEFAREMAVRLLQEGMEIEKINYVTDLSVEEIEKISNDLKKK